MKKILSAALAAIILSTGTSEVQACTNMLVGKKASVNGSTMISYNADSHTLYGELYFTPAADHQPGAMRQVFEWDTNKPLGSIPQPAHTYRVVGNVNEWQVTIAESTWGGDLALMDPNGVIDYGSLIYIALERSKTAREAIDIMTSLVAEYGYYSEGETFSIGDPDEVWVMDLIGKGPNNKGAVWVAQRILTIVSRLTLTQLASTSSHRQRRSSTRSSTAMRWAIPASSVQNSFRLHVLADTMVQTRILISHLLSAIRITAHTEVVTDVFGHSSTAMSRAWKSISTSWIWFQVQRLCHFISSRTASSLIVTSRNRWATTSKAPLGT